MVDVIERWVDEQLSQWRNPAFDRDILVDVEHREMEIFLFSFSGGTVEFKPKSVRVGWNDHRCDLYLSLFREAYRRICPDADFELLLYPGDQSDRTWQYPIFSFLKKRTSNEILVPDVDFIKTKYYAGSEFIDPFQSVEKTNTAIFAGSTTGVDRITREMLESNLVPRIKSARFFKGNPRVSFTLPSICQYGDESVREMIVAMNLGTQRVPWQNNSGACFFSRLTAMEPPARAWFLR